MGGGRKYVGTNFSVPNLDVEKIGTNHSEIEEILILFSRPGVWLHGQGCDEGVKRKKLTKMKIENGGSVCSVFLLPTFSQPNLAGVIPLSPLLSFRYILLSRSVTHNGEENQVQPNRPGGNYNGMSTISAPPTLRNSCEGKSVETVILEAIRK